MRNAFIASATCFVVASLAGAGEGQAFQRHQNGLGPDPDGDTNPATNTRAVARIGDAAEAALNPPYRVITFEAPPGRHGEPLGLQYAREFGVAFGKGLTRQICDGVRYFRYDSDCTYRRAPSGKYAALHYDYWGAPLEVKFAAPVCAAAMAIYPTGGKEGERYRVKLQPYAADGRALPPASVRFNWTQDTFRWRLMAGAFLLKEGATQVDVSVESLDQPKKNVRFLIDDVAFVETGCAELLADIADAAGVNASRRPAGPQSAGEELDLTTE